KVFVIFQRLHTKDAYSGSGIGLAMCKKIVEFHGGTIAVDQEYTGGTRITFTLAEAPPATAEPLPASELPRGEGPLGRGAGERPTAVRSGTEPTP
ncbi:ATP-binding protein, partial [Streptomyces sp. SID1034]